MDDKMVERDDDVPTPYSFSMRQKLGLAFMIYFSGATVLLVLADSISGQEGDGTTTGALILLSSSTGNEARIHLYEYVSGQLRSRWVSRTTGGMGTGAWLLDLNADGSPEIVAGVWNTYGSDAETTAASSLLIYQNTSGYYDLVLNHTETQRASFTMSRAVMMDYYGNGTNLLVWILNRSLVLVGYESGKPVVKAHLAPAGEWGFDVGDVNGDGRSDIVCADPAWHRRLLVYENQGQGVYTESLVEGVDQWGKQHMPYPLDEIRVGDVDGDGVNEIILGGCCAGSPTLSVWGYENLTYREIWSYLGGTIQSLDLGDVDGDGMNEIVTAAEFGTGQAEQRHGISIWKYNFSDRSFYRTWEDLNTRIPEGLSLCQMQNIRVSPIDSGQPPAIVGVTWSLGTKDTGRGRYLYVIRKGVNGYVATSIRVAGGTVIDVWPLGAVEKPEALWSKAGQVWNRTYGGPYMDWATSLIESGDGGYLLTGLTRSCGNGEADFYLLKLDGGGNKVWETTHGRAVDEDGTCVARSEDGGFVVAGGTDVQYVKEIHVVKVDGNGREMWEKTYEAGPYEMPRCDCIIADADGFLLAGKMWPGTYFPENYSSSDVGTDAYLLQIDGKGNKLWERTYGGDGDEAITGIVQTQDGGFLVVGTASDDAGSDVYCLRIDRRGNVLWERRFGGADSEEAKDVVPAPDGGYVIVGGRSPEDGLSDVYVLKIDAEGTLTWEKSFGGEGWDFGNCIIGRNDGYTVAAETWSCGDGGDLYLISLGLDGGLVWERISGGADIDRPYAMVAAKDDGLLIAGETWSAGSGLCDALLCKVGGDPWIFRSLSVAPSTVVPGKDESILVEAGVISTPIGGWGSITSIWVDLSDLGRSETVVMYDDGTHGDRLRGDRIYTGLVPVTSDLRSGQHRVVVSLVDDRSRTAWTTADIYILPSGNEVVYDEGLEEWSPLGASATLDPRSASRAFSGNVSLYVSADANGYVELAPPGGYPFDAFAYWSLDLEINPGDTQRFQPSVSVGILGLEAVSKMYLTNMGYSFSQNQWTHVSIPMSQFNSAGKPIIFIRVAVPLKGGFYLDNVQLKIVEPRVVVLLSCFVALAVRGLAALEGGADQRKTSFGS